MSRIVRFHVRRKTRLYGCHLDFINILISHSYFQLNALKPGIYRCSGFTSLLALSVFMCNPKRAYGGHLDFYQCFNKSFLLAVECLEIWHI